MFSIISGLLGGWILGLFGFKGVVIAGMLQIFGVTINVLGYYFLFAMFGVLSHLILLMKRKRNPNENAFEIKLNNLKENLDNLFDNNKKSKK